MSNHKLHRLEKGNPLCMCLVVCTLLVFVFWLKGIEIIDRNASDYPWYHTKDKLSLQCIEKSKRFVVRKMQSQISWCLGSGMNNGIHIVPGAQELVWRHQGQVWIWCVGYHGGRKTGEPKEKFLEQGWEQRSGRPALSPLSHPCSPRSVPDANIMSGQCAYQIFMYNLLANGTVRYWLYITKKEIDVLKHGHS